jgi:hypothetical protein
MAGPKLSQLPINKSSARLSAGVTKEAWHTDANIKYFPRDKEMFDNLDKLAKEYVFDTFGPDEPILNSNDKVVTMGSCFADRLRTWLANNGKNADYIQVPEGLNNSFAVRQYLEWALTGDNSSDAYWYDNDKILGAKKYEPNQKHKELLEHFKNTKAIVVTFGLGEVWKDKDTNMVFWRGIPETSYNPNKHICVTSTVQENVDNFKKIVSLIKTHAGSDKTIIFTLSPVPLNATFTNRPTIVSDCVSKSILRVALDEFFKNNDYNDVYYWPSFEMVRWVGAHTDFPTLFEDNTPRHVNQQVVNVIIENFVGKFFNQ